MNVAMKIFLFCLGTNISLQAAFLPPSLSQAAQKILDAVPEDDTKSLSLLPLQEALPAPTERYNCTRLHELILAKDKEAALAIIAANDDIACKGVDDNNNTPLHIAAKAGETDIVEALLLAYPELVNAINFLNETALWIAVNLAIDSSKRSERTQLHRYIAIMNLLLSCGASKDAWCTYCYQQLDPASGNMVTTYREVTLAELATRSGIPAIQQPFKIKPPQEAISPDIEEIMREYFV